MPSPLDASTAALPASKRCAPPLDAAAAGGIGVESTPGVGSVFTVTIDTGDLAGVPMLDPTSAMSSGPQPGPAGADEPARVEEPNLRPLDGGRVLLAEDGRDNQRLISFLLSRAGADVTVCENGQIAVDTIERATRDTLPHVVLVDMQTPVLDGYGAARRLRALGCAMPIVALTAHATEGDREKCVGAGCDEYLTKPVDRARLVATCGRLAGRAGAGRAAA